MTYLLHAHHVSWRYYVMKGTEPDCRDDAAMSCKAIPQDAKTPGIWNPLPYFDTVHENWQLDNITSVGNFFKSAKAGKLPAVSYSRMKASCESANSKRFVQVDLEDST
jgi:hypothetical protein